MTATLATAPPHMIMSLSLVRVEFNNPFLKERFHIVIESKHLPDAGTTENAFNLTPDELETRRIVWVDIAADRVKDHRADHEPAKFCSEKTKRGPLSGQWWGQNEPVMCCYKLVTIKFQVFGLQTRVEDIIMRNQQELLTKFHKSVFCLIDNWYGLTLDEIRLLEDQIKRELDSRLSELGMQSSKELKSAGSVKSTPY